MSGEPGSAFKFSLYVRLSFERTRRTASSGAVPLCRTRAIRARRCFVGAASAFIFRGVFFDGMDNITQTINRLSLHQIVAVGLECSGQKILIENDPRRKWFESIVDQLWPIAFAKLTRLLAENAHKLDWLVLSTLRL